MNHLVGETGLKPRSSSFAIVADIGPLTISHPFFAAATTRYALTHILPIMLLVLAAALVHIPIHALICSMGIATLGSGWAALELLFRKAHESEGCAASIRSRHAGGLGDVGFATIDAGRGHAHSRVAVELSRLDRCHG